jgi:hypothetical protein
MFVGTTLCFSIQSDLLKFVLGPLHVIMHEGECSMRNTDTYAHILPHALSLFPIIYSPCCIASYINLLKIALEYMHAEAITLEIMRHIWRSIRRCESFPCRKIQNQEELIILIMWIYYEFLKLKVGPNILRMSRVCHNHSFNCSFLLALALKPRTCVMALLVPT